MNGNDIIKRLVSGEFYHSYRQVKYMVCDDNTLVVLADFRLDCGIIDKILREHTFKHNMNPGDAPDRYVKNIYRVLMSRGKQGCYVYCCDRNLQMAGHRGTCHRL